MRVAAALDAARTTSRTSPPCSRCTGPGPMGANAHNDYADRKNGRKPIVPIHPELAEPLAEILGDTYGLIVYQEQVMAIAQKLAGYTLGNADLLRRAMGKKKKEILDKEYVPFSEGMQANGYSDARDQDAVGHPRPVLRLRVQQGAHRRVRPGVVLDGVPQGELPGRVHGRAAHLGARRQGQVGAVPRRVPADGHQGAAAGRQRVRRRLHPASARDIRFGLAAIRNVGANVVESIVADPREPRAASPTSTTSCARSSAVACNKRTVESLIKAGAFDSLGHTRRGLRRGARARRSTRSWTSSATRRSASSTCSAGDDERRRRRPTACRRRRSRWGSGTRRRCSPHEREMLGLYVSDHPLLGRRARAGRRRRLLDRRADRPTRTAPTARSSRSPAWSPGCSARSPSRATRGRSPPSRTSRARSR